MKFSSLDEVIDLYAKWGSRNYAEEITQTEHAVQCANLAIADNSSASLVVAALLHDIGHLIDLEMKEGYEEFQTDTHHEASGSRSLAEILPSSVRQPIALHVEAKRWLCAKEDGYLESLSAASLHSLGLQGGPMSEQESARFETMPGFADAISLRKWDDCGKNIDLTGSLDDFRQILSTYSEKLTQRTIEASVYLQQPSQKKDAAATVAPAGK